MSFGVGKRHDRKAFSAIRSTLLGTGVGVATIGGALPLIGWHAQSSILVRLGSTVSPIHYNTALGFLLFGTVYVCVALDRNRFATALVVAAGALGVATLLQYATGVDLGIDQFFVRDAMSVDLGHPGRMSVVTAASLSVLAGAFPPVPGERPRRPFITAVRTGIVVVVLGVGLLTVAGYPIDESAYSWGRLTHMSVPTGLMLIGASAGMFLTVLVRDSEHQPDAIAGVKTVTRAALMLAVAIVVNIAVLTYLSFVEVELETTARSHTTGALLQIESLRLALLNAETGQRGFLLTGDSAYLRPYRAAVRSLNEAMTGRPVYTTEDSLVRVTYEGLQPLIAAKLDELNSTVAMRAAGDPFGASLALRSGQADRLTGEIRDRIEGTASTLRSLRTARSDSVRVTTTRARSALLSGLGIVVILLLGAGTIAVRAHARGERAAAAVRESEARFRAMLENLPEGMVHILDRDLRYVYAGGHGLESMGLTRAAMLGRSIAEVLPPAVAEQAATCYRRCLEGDVVTYEWQSDGTWFLERATPIRRADGRITQVLALSTITTEMHDLKERLELRLEQLAQANRELESFGYSVSHDLRAPLRGVDGFTRILEEDYGEALDAEGRRLLGVVRSNAQRMSNLIDDLLRLSRLTTQTQRLELIEMDGLVREVLADLSVPDIVVVDVDALPEAVGDRALLRQVWINYLSNAVKYSAGHEQPHVEVTGGESPQEIVYTVTDNGAGFDMRYADKLFGVFQRLHGAEYEGTGIGLAIVRSIVRRHGGRVWADSRPGEGATFGFSIPRVDAGELGAAS